MSLCKVKQTLELGFIFCKLMEIVVYKKWLKAIVTDPPLHQYEMLGLKPSCGAIMPTICSACNKGVAKPPFYTDFHDSNASLL